LSSQRSYLKITTIIAGNQEIHIMNADDHDCNNNTGKAAGNMLPANSTKFAFKVKQNQIAEFLGKKR
jgi:hypothetical protein